MTLLQLLHDNSSHKWHCWWHCYNYYTWIYGDMDKRMVSEHISADRQLRKEVTVHSRCICRTTGPLSSLLGQSSTIFLSLSPIPYRSSSLTLTLTTTYHYPKTQQDPTKSNSQVAQCIVKCDSSCPWLETTDHQTIFYDHHRSLTTSLRKATVGFCRSFPWSIKHTNSECISIHYKYA